MILALSVIACGWSRLPSSELRSCITIANKTGGLSRQTSRSRDSVCEWFDLRANRLDLAKGMIMAFHISGKIGGVGGRTHWELCLVLTSCFTEPSTSACVEDRGKGIAP
uniref:Uncharacterized protein n=1 Tax=Ananas comosus var. bracteatus TaxID=296719 RepID=A0A6V7P265_ANACO|nr:unnamed protein product [Ananas comosus var. bracteatus]